MIWMDSYAKIHALTLGWVTCEDDLTDWTDETLWPLVSHTDIESMLWAMSAFVVITSTPPPAGVTPYIYRLVCKIVGDKIEQVIETKRKAAESCP